MASSQRLSTVISRAAKPSSTPFICASCRSRTQLLSRPQSTQQIRRASNIPFTEKLRRKIWGTDNPPGLKDPYGGPSFLERRRAQKEEEQRRAAGEDQPARAVEENVAEISDTAPPPVLEPIRREQVQRPSVHQSETLAEPTEYTEAETWDGLKWVGHRGDYRDMDEKSADDYTPWMQRPSQKVEDPVIWSTLHEAIFDATQPEDEPYDTDFHFSISETGEIESGAGVAAATDAAADQSFANATINFASPHTFKILKNFQHLTSIRLSDPWLNTIAHQRPHPTWSTFVAALKQQQSVIPNPKVNDLLEANQDLNALSNVQVFAEKVRPADKERALGRLKIIERELESRGLSPMAKKRVQRRTQPALE